MQYAGVIIRSIGIHLPGEPITNAELARDHGRVFDIEKHEATTRIFQRHWAPPGIATSHLAAAAAQQALQRAGLPASHVQRIVVGTSSADHPNISAACNVQHLLGATCPAVDMTAACAGFLYALEHGVGLVRAGADNVLVIGADTKSRFIKRDDVVFGPIFSDGGGAVLLGPSKGTGGFVDIDLWADGSGFTTICVPAGGSALPASEHTVAQDMHGTTMNMPGKDLAIGAARKMAELARNICARNGVSAKDVDVFVPHQANFYIMRKMAEELGIPPERMEVVIDRVGNCIAATVPIALEQAYASGRMRPGALALLVAAGAGYTGGAALYRVPE
jgi:3-oxoacyl-[acyl-carrier-protein] synthase III